MACKKGSVSLTELRSGSRRGKLPAVRVKIVQKLVEDYGVPIAETARQTGISTSGVSKILSRCPIVCPDSQQRPSIVPPKRVFDIDVEHCPNCGGALKIIAAIEDPPVIIKILSHLGLPTRAPPRSPARRVDLFQTI